MTPPPVGVEAVLTLGAEVAVETRLAVFYFTLWRTQERSEDRIELIQPSTTTTISTTLLVSLIQTKLELVS